MPVKLANVLVDIMHLVNVLGYFIGPPPIKSCTALNFAPVIGMVACISSIIVLLELGVHKPRTKPKAITKFDFKITYFNKQ